MAVSYTRFVVRTSVIKAAIILMNLIALASFFFIQVGSILFIIPAVIIDVIYALNREQSNIVKRDAIKPADKIAGLTLTVIIVSLVITAVLMVYGVMNSG